MKKELKKCPKCKGITRLGTTKSSTSGEILTYVYCTECYIQNTPGASEYRAIEKWNKQPHIEQLESELSKICQLIVDLNHDYVTKGIITDIRIKQFLMDYETMVC